MGFLRVLNPFVLNPTAPRHRTARATEQIARNTTPPRIRVDYRTETGKRLDAQMRAVNARIDAERAATRRPRDTRPVWERE